MKRSSKKKNNTKTSPSNSDFHGVVLTHPDKVLYSELGITKRDLGNYYSSISEWILPHVAGRPLALVRCPMGQSKPCFFQKHPGEHPSEFLKQVDVSMSDEPEMHVAIADEAGLMALVQMGVLEIHTWGCQAKNIEKPDRLIFDLDPDPSVAWEDVISAAYSIREFLEELGLVSFLKTTGGKGLHLVIPIQPRVCWDEVKMFCHSIASAIVQASPKRFVATMSKARRKGKIFIDYLRNGRGATSVAPYSTRAKASAPVSAPIAWSELTPRIRSDSFTVLNLPDRLKRLKSDPWEDLSKIKQSITKQMKSVLEDTTVTRQKP